VSKNVLVKTVLFVIQSLENVTARQDLEVRYVITDVLLVDMEMSVRANANVRMQVNVIHKLVIVCALLDGREWCAEKNVSPENGELIVVSHAIVLMKVIVTILLDNVNVCPDIMAKSAKIFVRKECMVQIV